MLHTYTDFFCHLNQQIICFLIKGGPNKQKTELLFLRFDILSSSKIVSFALDQGRSNTKIVGGGKVSENVGHHGWSKENILGFEWPKSAQMALKLFCFFRKFFKYV